MMMDAADQLKELLLKLKQNLPLTIATTIVMSILVISWKKLLHFAKRRLGFEEPPKEVLKPSLPEGDFARLSTLDKFRSGFSVPFGWRGAVVDAGVVQRELGPGRYRRRAVAKIIASLRLGENAHVVFWRDQEFPVVLYLRDLFASDHQPMQLEIRSTARVRPDRLTHSSPEEINRDPACWAEDLSAGIAVAARQWVAGMAAEAPYHNAAKLSEWCDVAAGWIRSALERSTFELVRVTGFRLFSPVLDKVFAEYGEAALEHEAARREVERNKVRGALRQAVLAGQLEEVRDQSEHEQAVRAIEQEKELREKALRQELAQAELTELEDKLRLWKKKQDLLLQTLDLSGQDSARQFDAPDSPFSAHEREQIRAVLQSQRAMSTQPEEVLPLLARSTEIQWAAFDPLARIRGPHTLRVGEGWRFFDGVSLWRIVLTRIDTRRNGFLWQRETPSRAYFEVRGTPDGRRYEQVVELNKHFRLSAGPHEMSVDFIGGSASRISLQVGQA